MSAEKTNFARAALANMNPRDFGKDTFLWVHLPNSKENLSFSQLMNIWRYRVSQNELGNTTSIAFIGELRGDCLLMFSAIAPYVEEGSYLQFESQGIRWGYYFTGEHLIEFDSP